MFDFTVFLSLTLYTLARHSLSPTIVNLARAGGHLLSRKEEVGAIH